MGVKFSNPSFQVTGPRNFYCLVPVLSKNVFLFQFSLKLLCCSHIQTMVLSVSFSRTTFRLLQVSCSSVNRLSIIHWHVGEQIFHDSLARFLFVSNQIILFLIPCLDLGRQFSLSQCAFGFRFCIYRPLIKHFLDIYIFVCTWFWCLKFLISMLCYCFY